MPVEHAGPLSWPVEPSPEAKPACDMTDQTKHSKRSWRRFTRLSVRSMIVVVVIGGGLGWLVRGARIQREAVAAIEWRGGRVNYEWDYRSADSVMHGSPWAPRRLVNRVGADYFGSVTIVTHNECSISATELVEISHLKRLETLLMASSGLADGDLLPLKSLRKLRSLRLSKNRITDRGLTILDGFSRLEYLGLDGTDVTDAGLVHLEGLSELQELRSRRHAGDRSWSGVPEGPDRPTSTRATKNELNRNAARQSRGVNKH